MRIKFIKKSNPKQNIGNIIAEILPKRLTFMICKENNVDGNISELSNKLLKQLSDSITSTVALMVILHFANKHTKLLYNIIFSQGAYMLVDIGQWA